MCDLISNHFKVLILLKIFLNKQETRLSIKMSSFLHCASSYNIMSEISPYLSGLGLNHRFERCPPLKSDEWGQEHHAPL